MTITPTWLPMYCGLENSGHACTNIFIISLILPTYYLTSLGWTFLDPAQTTGTNANPINGVDTPITILDFCCHKSINFKLSRILVISLQCKKVILKFFNKMQVFKYNFELVRSFLNQYNLSCTGTSCLKLVQSDILKGILFWGVINKTGAWFFRGVLKEQNILNKKYYTGSK